MDVYGLLKSPAAFLAEASPTIPAMSQWQQFGDLFREFNLTAFLLVGSGLLAVALLILSLTRWGQARPVWKCVILSIAAHILLIAYAYGTQLIFVQTPAPVAAVSSTRINLVEEEGDDLEDVAGPTGSEKTWNTFANEQLLPGLEALPRPLIDSEIEIDEPDADLHAAGTPDSMPIADTGQPLIDLTETDLAEFESQADLDTFSRPAAASQLNVDRRHDEDTAPEPDFMTAELEMPRPDFDDPESNGTSNEVEEYPVIAERVAPELPFTSDLISDDAAMPVGRENLPLGMAQPVREARPTTSAQFVHAPLTVIKPMSRSGDGKPMPEIYTLRGKQDRLTGARRRGGSIETERAVNEALAWLADAQDDDGRWNPRLHEGGREPAIHGHDRAGAGTNADSGISALAALAFMAGGHNHLEPGEYRETVQKGLEFLLRNQSTDGNLSGNASLFARMYCHSMSLLALSEALAVTGDQRLLPAVQKGVDYLVRAQNTYDGGWRYEPGDRGDMSQFGWQVLALKSARTGGANVPAQTIERMKHFLERCTSGPGEGLGSYRPGQGVSTSMTAEALVCRYFLNGDVEDLTRSTAMNRVMGELPSAHHINMYYWYYGTMAAYHSGGQAWEQWNKTLKVALLNTRERVGGNQGSWAPTGLWAPYGGRVYSTAMGALCLEVYYRYLPMYESGRTDRAEDLAGGQDDQGNGSHDGMQWR